jgi:hypothetical protein
MTPNGKVLTSKGGSGAAGAGGRGEPKIESISRRVFRLSCQDHQTTPVERGREGPESARLSGRAMVA